MLSLSPENNFFGLEGYAHLAGGGGNSVVLNHLDHPSVIDPFARLEKRYGQAIPARAMAIGVVHFPAPPGRTKTWKQRHP